ncbi:YoaK family protein [Gemmobacter serpentinus]|uniref:YoaK family protein n=1 Tax=Gemmobacter serpentinus TaxID=2652247 RepID=UPI00124F2FC9|nr:YoaK family protein [Gemmobacter serpentinus]
MKPALRRKLAHPGIASFALVAMGRSGPRDLALATVLAMVAGAANAGGFLAVGAYTSHMTGYLSQFADHLVLLDWRITGVAGLAVAAFICGAGFSALVINIARALDRRVQYALPLAIQGVFMACFATGGLLTSEPGRLFALWCLCFMMGMQNATITKISGARIRTTHATGMITDIGIEAGRMVSGWMLPHLGLRPDLAKLRILLQLVGAFVAGGILGGFGFAQFGFLFALPLSAILLALSLPLVLACLSHRPGRKPQPPAKPS